MSYEDRMEAAQDFVAEHADDYILNNLEEFVEQHEDAIREILKKLDEQRK